MHKKNHQTGTNLFHATSSLTEKFLTSQPCFLRLNYYTACMLGDHFEPEVSPLLQTGYCEPDVVNRKLFRFWKPEVENRKL